MNAVEKSNLMDNAPAGKISKRKAKNRKQQQRQQQQQNKQEPKLSSQVNTNSDDIKVKKTKTGIPTAETLKNDSNPENIHLFKQKLIDCLRIKTNGCIQQNNHITENYDSGADKVTEEAIDLRRTHISRPDEEYMEDNNVDIGAIALNVKSKNQIICEAKRIENCSKNTSIATRQTRIKSKSNDCRIQSSSDLITNIIILPEQHLRKANSIESNQQNSNLDNISRRVSGTNEEEGTQAIKIDSLSNAISSSSHYINYKCVNGEITPTLPSVSPTLSYNNSYYVNSSSCSSKNSICCNKKCTVTKKSKTKSLKAIAAESSLANTVVPPSSSSALSGSSEMSSWPSSSTIKSKSMDSKKFKKFIKSTEKSENVAVGINGRNNNCNDLIVIGAILPNSKTIPSTSTTNCDEASGHTVDFNAHLSYHYGATYQKEQHTSDNTTQCHYQLNRRIQNDEISNTLRDKVKIVTSEKNDGSTICKNKKIEELMMHNSITGTCHKHHVQYNGDITNSTNDNYEDDGEVKNEDDNNDDGNNFIDNDDMQIDENTDNNNENKISSQGLDLRINTVKQTPKTIVNENLTKNIDVEKDIKKETVISSEPSISSQQPTSSSLMACQREDGTLDPSNIIIDYKEYESELQMQDIMRLIQKELSEPYSIYTYRYFIYNWPKLCFLAAHGNEYVGAIVCKLDMHMNVKRGYIAMLAVKKEYRKMKIGTNLVQKAIEAMLADDAAEVVLETEMKNVPALRLYENLGFVRDKRLFRYYLNGVDALRLKLWFR